MAKPSFQPQYKRITEIVRERILNGSYSLKPFPSDRRLAEELGVNYMTIRRGLQILKKDNMLVRLPNGRVQVKHIQQGKKGHLNFCFLSPASSADVDRWRWAVQKLLDHLATLGHTQIGCLNTQPSHSEIQERVNQWRYWMAAHGKKGYLADCPGPFRSDPIQTAYDVMTKILADPERKETVWVCMTTPSAMGAMRAMLDRGIQPGRDIAICSVNGESIASFLNPPLTALEAYDPAPFLRICLDWMMRGGSNWQGPLLMRPNDVHLVIRESTQPGAGRGPSTAARPPAAV